MKSIKSFQNVIKPTSRKFSNSVIFEKYNQMAKIMKFLIFSLFFATSVGKEIVGKTPEFVFKTQTECINGDFFYSPNVSVKLNIFQVIARMEFTYPNGVSTFYTYFENNLAVVIPTREHSLSINCYSNPSKLEKTNLDFVFEFYGCNRIVTFAHRLTYHTDLACDLNYDKRVFWESFYTDGDYLGLFGMARINETYLDVAAWILFKDSSYFAKTTQQLERHLTKFLIVFNQRMKNLKLTEKDFKVNEIKDKMPCNIGISGKAIYKKISEDIKAMTHERVEKVNNLQFKNIIQNFLLGVVTIFGIFATILIVKTLIAYKRKVSLTLFT